MILLPGCFLKTFIDIMLFSLLFFIYIPFFTCIVFYSPLFYHVQQVVTSVGFVAAAVSMSMGGCRAVLAVSLLPAVVADVAIAVGPAVL